MDKTKLYSVRISMLYKLYEFNLINKHEFLKIKHRLMRDFNKKAKNSSICDIITL